jgi:hypothetical protein
LKEQEEIVEANKEIYDEYEKLLKNIRELRDARLEYYEKIFEDDLSYAAEGFAVMVDKFGNQLTDLSTFQEQRDKIKELYAGDPEAMNEKLQELYKDTYSQLGDIQGLTKEILDYYGSVLKMTREELDKSVAHIDSIAGTLDHYKNLMDILGRSTDYEALGKILTGQAMVAANQREIEENYLAELLAQ